MSREDPKKVQDPPLDGAQDWVAVSFRRANGDFFGGSIPEVPILPSFRFIGRTLLDGG
jgi:hypothetical protein